PFEGAGVALQVRRRSRRKRLCARGASLAWSCGPSTSPLGAKEGAVFRNLRLRYRAAKRIGAFGRATQQGMTAEQARAASDAVYPSTAEDLAFEASLREGTADPLPWGSMLGLLVAVAALLYILRAPATALEIAGSALSP